MEVGANAGDVIVGDARLDDVLELISEDGLLRVDARQGRENQVDRNIARTSQQVRADYWYTFVFRIWAAAGLEDWLSE